MNSKKNLSFSTLYKDFYISKAVKWGIFFLIRFLPLTMYVE